MPSHAASIPLKKRLLKPAAIAAVILLGALGMTEGTSSAAKAAALLSCDQNTIYAITNTGGDISSINLATGDTAVVKNIGTANNALAISPNGTSLYATVNAGTTNASGTITQYRTSDDAVISHTPVSIANNIYRGAINPLNSIYYYAQGGVADPVVYAYDTKTDTSLGEVGVLTGVTAGNGDFAFSTTGQLFLAAGNQVRRVDVTMPTTAGTTSLASSVVTTLPTGTNSPGIAFSTNGFLYVASGKTLLKIDPSSGANVGTVTMSTGITPTDLASCNYADTVSGRASVDQRWQSGDQFTLTVSGNGLASGNTATTTGTATGLQSAIAGASLVAAGKTYTVTESKAGTTDLANYDTSWVCATKDIDGTTTSTDGSGTTASVSIPTTAKDSDVSCVFTNKLIAVHASAVDDKGHTPTDTALTVAGPGVLVNDTVGTGGAIDSYTQPSHGSVTLNKTTGAYTYTPASGYTGTDSFTYTLKDSSGTSSTATVTIVVGPTAVADSGSVDANGTLTVTADKGVLANDKGDGLTAAKATDPSHGTVTVNSDGSYVYTPTPEYSGPDSFTYTVTDSGGDTAIGTVSIAVAPKANDDTAPATRWNTTATIAASTLLGNDHGSSLTITEVGTPQTGTVTLSADGTTLTYVPKTRTTGVDTFTYTVTDANGNTSTATVTIHIVPTAADDTLPSTSAGMPETISSSTILGNDRGTGLTVTGVSAASNGTVSLSTDRTTITFTPADGYSGPAQFTYTVADSSGNTATATARLAVTPASGATATTAVSGDDDVVPADQGVLSDSTGTGLTATITTDPQHGTVTLQEDGSYTYTSDKTFSGTDTFGYTVTDSAGGTTTGTVTVTVVPKAIDDTAQKTDAGVVETIPAATLTGNDNGSAPLAVAGITQGDHGRVTLNADGTVSYRPYSGWSGTDTFTYTVTDGSTVSAPATVTITTRPVAVDDAVPSTPAGTDAVIAPSALLSNDKGTTLTLKSVGSPSAGKVSIGDDGNVVYEPAAGFSGDFTFEYTAVDPEGQTTTATATIAVTPTAGPLDLDATAGTVSDVPAKDGLLSGASGTDLTPTIVDEPEHGTLELGEDGAYTYTPAPGYSGPDSFTYTVTDGSGQTSDPATVTITVLPKAVGDSADAKSGTATPIAIADLLSDDKGTDLELDSFTQPTGGSVTDDGAGHLVFTSDDDFSGETTFTYTVKDPSGGTATATVTVTVTPVAKADTGSTTAGAKLTVAATEGLLANDRGSDLHASLAASPANGEATVKADGSYVYTPKDGFSGTDSFSYTLTDGSGQTTTGTVTITVTPTAAADPYTTTAGVGVHHDAPGVLANDSGTQLTVDDVDGHTPGAAVTTANGGTVTIGADGTIDYTPATGFSGTDTVDYTVVDKDGQETTATVTVTVKPVATSDYFSTPSATDLAIAEADLTGDDSGSLLSLTATGTPKHGTLTPASSGFTYTPDAAFSGTDSFTYTVTDSSGQEATATAYILVGDRAADYTVDAASGEPYTVGVADGVLKDARGTGLKAALDQAPTHGTVTVAEDGSYVYTPAAGFSGTDTFTYTATDAEGQVSTGIVTITVKPTASNDTERTRAGRSITVGGAGTGGRGILGNDSGTGLTVTTVSTPDHGGTAVISGEGVLTYTPAAGFSGVETFTYTAVDSSGQEATATVTVTVVPTAVNDSGSTTMGHALKVPASKGLLSDDLGSGLTAALKTKPKHGTVVVNADGSYVYTPADGFTGADSFTYTATDSSGQVVTAKAVIMVAPGAHAVDDSVKGTPNKRATLNVLANDRASSGASLDSSTVGLIDPQTGKVVSSVAIDGKGTFRVAGSTVTFDPEHNFHGTASVQYRVIDTEGVSIRALASVVYPTVVAAVISGTVAGAATSLAFTGSTGTGLTLVVGAGILLLGLGLVAGRRLRRPVPGPRRTGL